MKLSKLVMVGFVLLLLLAFVDAQLAQHPGKPETGKISTQQARIHEPQKEATIRNSLADMLVDKGVRVPVQLPVSQGNAHKVVQLRWESSAPPTKTDVGGLEQRSTLGTLTALSSARRNGTLPRERSFELSLNQILVVALDRNKELRWWRLMLDPRLVRAESPLPTGEIRGEDYYVPAVEFIVAYPDDPDISELRLYHPQWNGKTFQLELLSTLPVN